MLRLLVVLGILVRSGEPIRNSPAGISTSFIPIELVMIESPAGHQAWGVEGTQTVGGGGNRSLRHLGRGGGCFVPYLGLRRGAIQDAP